VVLGFSWRCDLGDPPVYPTYIFLTALSSFASRSKTPLPLPPFERRLPSFSQLQQALSSVPVKVSPHLRPGRRLLEPQVLSHCDKLPHCSPGEQFSLPVKYFSSTSLARSRSFIVAESEESNWSLRTCSKIFQSLLGRQIDLGSYDSSIDRKVRGLPGHLLCKGLALLLA